MLPVPSPSMALVSRHQVREGRAPLQFDPAPGRPGEHPGMVVVPPDASVEAVAALVRQRLDALPGRRLATLVIWCHGEPGLLRLCDPPVTIDRLGPWVRAWAGRIDEVILIACRVAAIGTAREVKDGINAGDIDPAVARSPQAMRAMVAQMDGNQFCSRLASGLRCRVTAATATQWNFTMGGIGLPSYPRNHIPDFEGEVFTWGPTGAIVGRRSLPSGRMNGDLHNS
ncbi:hypothetical protein [Piscinibacter sakaiensis]|uniref:hypothetical protein n=1 Tax=Piscinibacter sakaiensis TaxID=1547922 RepID=UPI00372D32C3